MCIRDRALDVNPYTLYDTAGHDASEMMELLFWLDEFNPCLLYTSWLQVTEIPDSYIMQNTHILIKRILLTILISLPLTILVVVLISKNPVSYTHLDVYKRQELNLTQPYVAEKMGVTASTILRYENGSIDNTKKMVLEGCLLYTSFPNQPPLGFRRRTDKPCR